MMPERFLVSHVLGRRVVVYGPALSGGVGTAIHLVLTREVRDWGRRRLYPYASWQTDWGYISTFLESGRFVVEDIGEGGRTWSRGVRSGLISTSLQLALSFPAPRSRSYKSTSLSALLLPISAVFLLLLLVRFHCRNAFKICARKVSIEGTGIITSLQTDSDSDFIWLTGMYLWCPTSIPHSPPPPAWWLAISIDPLSGDVSVLPAKQHS